MGDPTPDEMRRRRAEIHRFRGEEQDALNVLDGRNTAGERAINYEHLIPEDDEAEPKYRTVCEIGLPTRIAEPLERYGVMFAGELAGYTEQRLRLIKEFGDGSIAEIRKTLANIGLELRVQCPGESTPPLPPEIVQVVREVSGSKLTAHQIDRMFNLMARGVSQREIAKHLRIIRWTVWNRLRMFKVMVRGLIELGATDDELHDRLDEDRWIVWQKSLVWDHRRVRRAA